MNVLQRKILMAKLPFKSDTLQRMLLGTLCLGQKPKTDEFVGIKLRENILAIAIS